MLSGALVSGRIFQKRWAVEGAKQGARFQMRLYLYKRGDCFFISSFLAGKEANGAVAVDKPGQKIERGKTGAPGQGEEEDEKDRPESAAAIGCPFQRSTGQGKDGKARKKIPGVESVIKEYRGAGRGNGHGPPPLGSPRSMGYIFRFSSG